MVVLKERDQYKERGKEQYEQQHVRESELQGKLGMNRIHEPLVNGNCEHCVRKNQKRYLCDTTECVGKRDAVLALAVSPSHNDVLTHSCETG